jgi:hypothetical protein
METGYTEEEAIIITPATGAGAGPAAPGRQAVGTIIPEDIIGIEDAGDKAHHFQPFMPDEDALCPYRAFY